MKNAKLMQMPTEQSSGRGVCCATGPKSEHHGEHLLKGNNRPFHIFNVGQAALHMVQPVTFVIGFRLEMYITKLNHILKMCIVYVTNQS